jgi:hypothetical protein
VTFWSARVKYLEKRECERKLEMRKERKNIKGERT